MTDSEIDLNIDFQRALALLDRYDTPQRMLQVWRMAGTYPGRVPPPEVKRPWYKGLEHLISRGR